MISFWRRIKKLNPAAKMLVVFIVAILGLSILFAPRPTPVNFDDLNFEYTSSSRLYFHNVRSYYYNIFEKEKPPFILYRYKRRLRDTLEPRVQFMIIENLLADEAYIFAELNPAAAKIDYLNILVSEVENHPSEILPLENINNEGHLYLATSIYRRLLANEQIYLLNSYDTVIELFNTEKERNNALSVLEDYFNLINRN